MSGKGCGSSGGDALQEASGQISQGILLMMIASMFVPVIKMNQSIYFNRVKVVFISITGMAAVTAQVSSQGRVTRVHQILC